MASRRTSTNVYDYPEHLNPFHEEDNHNRLRFWTVTKKKSRSNSFSFQSVKDFRGSIRLPRPSRNRADTASSLSQLNCLGTTPKSHSHTIQTTPSPSQSHNDNRFYSTLRKLSRTFSIRNKNKSNSNSVEQPPSIENDVEIRVRPNVRLSAAPAPLPLPRSRFSSRVPKTDSGSNVDPDSDSDDKNPFSNDDDQETKPVTPVRKKKKAPPPPARHSSLKANTYADHQASKQSLAEPEQSTDHNELTTDIQVKIEQVVIVNNSEENNINKDEANNQEIIVDIKTKDNNDHVTEEKSIEVKEADKTIISEESEIDISTKEDNNDNVSTKDTEVNKETYNEESKDDINTNKDIVIEDKPIEDSAANEESRVEINTKENNNDNEIENNTNIPNAECCMNINYNTEVILQRVDADADATEESVEDASDLVELVNKLQKEVEKLTDDTNNNNVVESEEERKIRNMRTWIPLGNHKTEMDVHLNQQYQYQDDDDDVVSGPMSPRLVRLRQDDDWIRPQQL